MSSHVICAHDIEKIGIYFRNQDAENHSAKPFNIHRPCTVDFWPDSLLVKNQAQPVDVKLSENYATKSLTYIDHVP